MEATVIKIGSSLGLKVPESIVRDYNLKPGSIVEMYLRKNGELDLCGKAKIREGWDEKFARYAKDGEDKELLPDFFDSETDTLL